MVGATRSKPIITQPLSISVANKDVLIIDDVADSGQSLKLVSDHIKEQGANRVKTTTIYCKPWSEIVPNYFEKKTTCWVIFPWEPKEVIKNLIEQYLREGGPIDEARNKLRRSGLDPELTERFIGKILAERSVKT